MLYPSLNPLVISAVLITSVPSANLNFEFPGISEHGDTLGFASSAQYFPVVHFFVYPPAFPDALLSPGEKMVAIDAEPYTPFSPKVVYLCAPVPPLLGASPPLTLIPEPSPPLPMLPASPPEPTAANKVPFSNKNGVFIVESNPAITYSVFAFILNLKYDIPPLPPEYVVVP